MTCVMVSMPRKHERRGEHETVVELFKDWETARASVKETVSSFGDVVLHPRPGGTVENAYCAGNYCATLEEREIHSKVTHL